MVVGTLVTPFAAAFLGEGFADFFAEEALFEEEGATGFEVGYYRDVSISAGNGVGCRDGTGGVCSTGAAGVA